MIDPLRRHCEQPGDGNEGRALIRLRGFGVRHKQVTISGLLSAERSRVGAAGLQPLSRKVTPAACRLPERTLSLRVMLALGLVIE